MVFLSSGHNSQSKTIKQDPGATGNGFKEGDLTIEFKHLVSKELNALEVAHIMDTEEESLQQYVNRIKTGNGSVVIEYHFDAGPESASGTTSIVEFDKDKNDMSFGHELGWATSSILGIKYRGLITEADTRHKRLALMTENGIVCLHEICFITNSNDVAQFQAKKEQLAKAHAVIIKKYEDLIK